MVPDKVGMRSGLYERDKTAAGRRGAKGAGRGERGGDSGAGNFSSFVARRTAVVEGRRTVQGASLFRDIPEQRCSR